MASQQTINTQYWYSTVVARPENFCGLESFSNRVPYYSNV